jgi:zinc transporter ZupT
MEIINVGLFALITAIATSIGVLPILFLKDRQSKKFQGYGVAIAGGLMLAASVGLAYEGFAYGSWQTLTGAIIGLVFITLGHRWLEKRSDQVSVGNLVGADAVRAVTIIGILTIHSFAEGVGIGVAFGDGLAFGLFITIALAIHNIPEGLAVGLSLMPKGVSAGKSAWYAFLTSLPQPLVAIPAFIFVTLFLPLLPFGLGFAAGAMIWLVFAELIPESLDDIGADAMAVAATLSFILMIGFQILLTSLI